MSGEEFKCEDPFRNKISCSKKRWEHIVSEYPSLTNGQLIIEYTICDPDFICRLRMIDSHLFSYYKAVKTKTLQDKCTTALRVVILFDGDICNSIDNDGKSLGEIVTAFCVAGTQLGEELVWPEGPN